MADFAVEVQLFLVKLSWKKWAFQEFLSYQEIWEYENEMEVNLWQNKSFVASLNYILFFVNTDLVRKF